MTTAVNTDSAEFTGDEIANDNDLEGTHEDNASPETESSESATPAKPVEDLDELSQMLVKRLRNTREKYVNLFERVKSATEGAAQKLTDTIETSTDPEVIKRREMLEKLNAKALELETQIQELVRPHLNIPSEDQVKAMQDEANKLASVFKQSTKLFDEVNEDQAKAVDYVENLPGMRSASKTTGNTDGIKRPRLKSVEVAKGSNPETATFKRLGDKKSSTFTHLRNWIKAEYKKDVPAPELHETWVKQNHGGEWSDLPDVTTFTASVDGNSFIVRITK